MNGLEKINKSATYTKVVTIKDIYRTDEPIIPEGYEAIAFRSPRDGELYIADTKVIGIEEVYSCDRRGTRHMWTDADMRIIVRKKPKEFTDTEILDRLIMWTWETVPKAYLRGIPGYGNNGLIMDGADTYTAEQLRTAIVEKMRADYENGNVKGAKE